MANDKKANPILKVRCILMWPFLRRKSDQSDKYQVDLTQLSPKAVEALEEAGIDVRFDKEAPNKGKFITCYSLHPIKAYATDGEEIEEIVGNGTEALVKLRPYYWTYKGKPGTSMGIVKLTVTNLVEYVGEGDDDDDASPAL